MIAWRGIIEKMSVDAIIQEAINIIQKHIAGNYQILLFGSWEKGSAIDTSDIDIAILGDQKIPWDCMAKVLDDKENIRTLRSIDIVDLNTKSKAFRENVLSYAKIVS